MSLKSSLQNVVIQRQKSRKAHLRRELSPTMLNAEVFFDILSLSCKTVSYHHSFHVRQSTAAAFVGRRRGVLSLLVMRLQLDEEFPGNADQAVRRATPITNSTMSRSMSISTTRKCLCNALNVATPRFETSV